MFFLVKYPPTPGYRPGKHAQDADGLSHNPLSNPEELSDEVGPRSYLEEAPDIETLERVCTETMSREEQKLLLSPPDASQVSTADVNMLNLTSVVDMKSAPILEAVSKNEPSEAQSRDSTIGHVRR